MLKGSKIKSIVQSTCPVCQEGRLFESHAYDFKKMFKMRKKCVKCESNLAPEPGFYDGAMYVSYAFGTGIVLAVFITFNLLYDFPDIWMMIGTASSLIILLSPLNFRLSRNIWSNLFFDFNPKRAEEAKDKKTR